MKTIEAMLQAHPDAISNRIESMTTTLAALAECEQACLSCADACLSERSLDQLRACIRLTLDCASICSVSAQLILRQNDTSGSILHAQLHACSVACQVCGDACALHAQHQRHCEICARACRECQERCNVLLGELSSTGVVGSD
jgi:hypothetical protein